MDYLKRFLGKGKEAIAALAAVILALVGLFNLATDSHVTINPDRLFEVLALIVGVGGGWIGSRANHIRTADELKARDDAQQRELDELKRQLNRRS